MCIRDSLYDMVSSLPAGAISQETLEEKTYEPMKGIIEEELSAYLSLIHICLAAGLFCLILL